MTTPMNNTTKRDFCDHLAAKVFKAQISDCAEKIKSQSQGIASMIATDETIELASRMPKNMVVLSNSVLVRVTYPPTSSNFPSRTKEIFVPLPVRMPVPRSYSSSQAVISINQSDIKKKSPTPLPEWALEQSSHFWHKTLVPLLIETYQAIGEQRAFEKMLQDRMTQVTSLKKLKAAAPDLHTAWLDYFGESVQNLPSLIFDDVIAIMEKKAS
jgi:hypothetical protein